MALLMLGPLIGDVGLETRGVLVVVVVVVVVRCGGGERSVVVLIMELCVTCHYY